MPCSLRQTWPGHRWWRTRSLENCTAGGKRLPGNMAALPLRSHSSTHSADCIHSFGWDWRVYFQDWEPVNTSARITSLLVAVSLTDHFNCYLLWSLGSSFFPMLNVCTSHGKCQFNILSCSYFMNRYLNASPLHSPLPLPLHPFCTKSFPAAKSVGNGFCYYFTTTSMRCATWIICIHRSLSNIYPLSKETLHIFSFWGMNLSVQD